MSKSHESLPETNQESENDFKVSIKEEIKKEVKQEMKQEFFHHKKKKLCFFKLFIVFLLGLTIGFFAGHHDGHGYRHEGYMNHDGRQMEMQDGKHMEKQMNYNHNGG
jgi:hypothetical protein